MVLIHMDSRLARGGDSLQCLLNANVQSLTSCLSFVICDAGGGTVDLISYTILKLKPILEVQEATPGTGALCGSTFLNLRFKKFLTSRLGKQAGFDDEVMTEAMEKFEKTVKRQFTMSAAPDDTYIIPVGGLANNKALGISRGRYSMKVCVPDVWYTWRLKPISSTRIHNRAF